METTCPRVFLSNDSVARPPSDDKSIGTAAAGCGTGTLVLSEELKISIVSGTRRRTILSGREASKQAIYQSMDQAVDSRMGKWLGHIVSSR